MSHLSDRLIAARRGAGLSQAEAAEKSGVSRATISNAETGVYEMPTLTTLSRLASVYRADLSSWLSPHDDASEASETSPENDQAPIPTAATR